MNRGPVVILYLEHTHYSYVLAVSHRYPMHKYLVRGRQHIVICLVSFLPDEVPRVAAKIRASRAKQCMVVDWSCVALFLLGKLEWMRAKE